MVPLCQTFPGITVEQPLLKNFGKDANLADLRVAQLNKKSQSLNWQQNVSSAVQGVLATYYDMEAALEDMHCPRTRSRRIQSSWNSTASAGSRFFHADAGRIPRAANPPRSHPRARAYLRPPPPCHSKWRARPGCRRNVLCQFRIWDFLFNCATRRSARLASLPKFLSSGCVVSPREGLVKGDHGLGSPAKVLRKRLTEAWTDSASVGRAALQARDALRILLIEHDDVIEYGLNNRLCG